MSRYVLHTLMGNERAFASERVLPRSKEKDTEVSTRGFERDRER